LELKYSSEEGDDDQQPLIIAEVPLKITLKNSSNNKTTELDAVAQVPQDQEIESSLMFNKITFESDNKYSPILGDLDEELNEKQIEFFAKAAGLDDSFAKIVVGIVENEEQKKYVQWLQDFKSFVQ